MNSHPGSIERKLEPLVATIRATALPEREKQTPARPKPKPFITVSRETGAGGWTLAQNLVERLNLLDHPDPPWSCWDRELVEKVAADHHLSRELIESVEEETTSWLSDFLSGLSFSEEQPDSFRAYRRTAQTIRALAQAGHVVVVGRGGVFITRDLPAGIHVRLVAPLRFRIAELARRENLTPDQAAASIRHKDAARRAFFERHWPSYALNPDLFAITLNTGVIDQDQAVECLLPLIHSREVAASA